MLRPLLSCLPAVAAAIVAWAALGGRSEPVRYVQVLGGPTRAGEHLSVLLRALRLDDGRPSPLPRLALRASARRGDELAKTSGDTDATGHLELRFDFTRDKSDDPELRVESAQGELLAECRASLDAERWLADTRRDGGWLSGQALGDVLVEVGVLSGVLAVPFESALLVRALVSDPLGGLAPLAGASMEVELTGAELLAPAAPTDARGRSRLPVRPEEHSVSLRLQVRGGGREGGWYGALPVRPGALLGTRDGAQLIVRSPIPRAQAYVSWITRRERVAGGLVSLLEAPDGTSSGRLTLDPATLGRLDAEPSWVVVSSEYDKRSAGTVGWSFGVAVDPDAPPTTLDAADQVLCDGRAQAIEREQQRSDRRRRHAGAALLGVGGLMGALFWVEVRGRRGRSQERVPAPDSEETLTVGTAPGAGLLAVALLCITLGVAALAYFGLLAR